MTFSHARRHRTSSCTSLRRRIVIAFCLSWITNVVFAADSGKSQNLAKFEAPYTGTPASNFLRENVTPIGLVALEVTFGGFPETLLRPGIALHFGHGSDSERRCIQRQLCEIKLFVDRRDGPVGPGPPPDGPGRG